MKSDEDVRMISAEAPVLFAKACEMFILGMLYKLILFDALVYAIHVFLISAYL